MLTCSKVSRTACLQGCRKCSSENTQLDSCLRREVSYQLKRKFFNDYLIFFFFFFSSNNLSIYFKYFKAQGVFLSSFAECKNFKANIAINFCLEGLPALLFVVRKELVTKHKPGYTPEKVLAYSEFAGAPHWSIIFLIIIYEPH